MTTSTARQAPAATAMPHVDVVTVGIEPMDPAMRGLGLAYLRHAHVVVMVRVGTASSILCTDNDPDRWAALEDIARAYASKAGAILLAPRYPACGWCGLAESPDLSGCPDPEDHRFSIARSETTWRTAPLGAPAADDLTMWSPR